MELRAAPALEACSPKPTTDSVLRKNGSRTESATR